MIGIGVNSENKDLINNPLDKMFDEGLEKDIEITDQQRKLATKISSKYCEDGKCIYGKVSGVMYECCSNCKRLTRNGCTNKTNKCLIYFCDSVRKKMNKLERNILRINTFPRVKESVDLLRQAKHRYKRDENFEF